MEYTTYHNIRKLLSSKAYYSYVTPLSPSSHWNYVGDDQWTQQGGPIFGPYSRIAISGGLNHSNTDYKYYVYAQRDGSYLKCSYFSVKKSDGSYTALGRAWKGPDAFTGNSNAFDLDGRVLVYNLASYFSGMNNEGVYLPGKIEYKIGIVPPEIIDPTVATEPEPKLFLYPPTAVTDNIIVNTSHNFTGEISGDGVGSGTYTIELSESLSSYAPLGRLYDKRQGEWIEKDFYRFTRRYFHLYISTNYSNN